MHSTDDVEYTEEELKAVIYGLLALGVCGVAVVVSVVVGVGGFLFWLLG